MSVKQCMDAIDERITRIAELTEIALARADALAERDKYFEQVKMLDKKVHNQREEINRLIAERDRRHAETERQACLQAETLGRRIAELERALRAISDEAREGYYDGPGLQRFVEIRGLAEDALAPVGGASGGKEGK